MGISYSLVQTLLLYDVAFSHNTLCHRQTDSKTDRRGDRQMTLWWQQPTILHGSTIGSTIIIWANY